MCSFSRPTDDTAMTVPLASVLNVEKPVDAIDAASSIPIGPRALEASAAVAPCPVATMTQQQQHHPFDSRLSLVTVPKAKEASMVTMFIANLPVVVTEKERASMITGLRRFLSTLGDFEEVKVRVPKQEPRAMSAYVRSPIAFAILKDSRHVDHVVAEAQHSHFMGHILRIETAWSQKILVLRCPASSNIETLKTEEPWVSMKRTSNFRANPDMVSNGPITCDMIGTACCVFGFINAVQPRIETCTTDDAQDFEVVFQHWQDCKRAGEAFAAVTEKSGIQPYVRSEIKNPAFPPSYRKHNLATSLHTPSPAPSTPGLTSAETPSESDHERSSALGPHFGETKDKEIAFDTSQETVDEYCVYVNRLHHDVLDLRGKLATFFAYDEVLPTVSVLRSKTYDGCYAFVRFRTRSGAQAAMKKDGVVFEGKPLMVRQRIVTPSRPVAKPEMRKSPQQFLSWDDQMREEETAAYGMKKHAAKRQSRMGLRINGFALAPTGKSSDTMKSLVTTTGCEETVKGSGMKCPPAPRSSLLDTKDMDSSTSPHRKLERTQVHPPVQRKASGASITPPVNVIPLAPMFVQQEHAQSALRQAPVMSQGQSPSPPSQHFFSAPFPFPHSGLLPLPPMAAFQMGMVPHFTNGSYLEPFYLPVGVSLTPMGMQTWQSSPNEASMRFVNPALSPYHGYSMDCALPLQSNEGFDKEAQHQQNSSAPIQIPAWQEHGY